MNTEEIVKATAQLVAIPSTANNLPALQEATAVIFDMLKDVPGITVERFEREGTPSLLAYAGKTRPTRFDVLLHGHVDVVPGKPEQFAAVQKDGKLYGRGVHDMKTAAIVLTDIFRQHAPTVPYNLGLQIVADEEVGGYHGVKYHLAEGVRTTFAITGEQNFHDNVIYNAARGICWIEVAFSGQTAHGAYVWHGDNAIDKATKFAHTIMQHYPRPEQEIWGTTANIASIGTPNDTFNRIPDHATVRVDFRFTAENPVFKDRASVEAYVRSIDPTARITAFATMESAVHVHEDNPYLQLLATSLGDTIKQTVNFLSRPGASDGRHFAALDIDVVEYGITGHGAHSDHEYIEIDSITSYVATLQNFLTNPKLAQLAESNTHATRTRARTTAPTAVGLTAHN